MTTATRQPVGRSTVRWRWLARKAAVAIGAVLLILFLVVFLGQRTFLYQAPRTGALAVPPGARELHAVATDGVMTPVWFFPATNPGCASVGRAPTIVFFHGIASARSDVLGVADTYVARGYNVVLPEYRGFADADGSPSEEGLMADARAVYTLTRDQAEVDPDRIVVGAFSLGTGVAVRLATEVPVAAVSIWAPYTSLPDVAWHMYPVLPYHLLMWDEFDSEANVGRVPVPLFVAEGTDDSMIPNEQSEAVYRAATHPDGLVRFDGVDHVPTYVAAVGSTEVAAFFDRHSDCHAGPAVP